MSNMTSVEDRTKLLRLVATNPEVADLVRRALDVEEEGSKSEYYLGWEWHEAHMRPQRLAVLVEEGLIRISYSSNSSKNYMLTDPEAAKDALAVVEQGGDEEDVPKDLFDHIVGYDDVKHWLTKSLGATQPVHILLLGPPATAKSLFLEALSSLPNSQYALGGATSRAGVADFLLNFKPRYLVIDELDKMKREDFSVLLSLMSSGIVAKLKKGMRQVEEMTTWVFAGCNLAKRLPPELLSRFIRFDFRTYTRDEFVTVAMHVITQLGTPEDLARYIAEHVALRTRDVRQAVQIAKLVDSEEELDMLEKGFGEGRLF